MPKREVMSVATPARLRDSGRWISFDSLRSGRACRQFNILDEGNL
jgi:hypothetical protein